MKAEEELTNPVVKAVVTAIRIGDRVKHSLLHSTPRQSLQV